MNGDIGLSRTDDQVFAVKALIVFRIVVISFFLGTVLLFQRRFGIISFPLPISLLIAATYLISIIYLLMLNRVHHHSLFLYTQLLLDVVIETAIIYTTGGVMSPISIFTVMMIPR